MLPLLDDPSAAVVREAAKTLVENAHRVPVEALAARTAPERSYLQRSHALRISDSCGFAVPVMEYREERSLHADFFNRKTDEEFNTYCEGKEHIATSIDGLPALPLPLPPLPHSEQ